MSERPTNAERVRDRWRAIREAPHRELDRQLDQALEVDDDRDRNRAEPEQLAGEEGGAAA